VLTFEGKYSCLRAKPAHLVGHLPTRAADRPTGLIDEFYQKTIFQAGHEVWTSFQQGVVNFVNTHSGTASVTSTIHEQYDWNSVSSLYHHPTTSWLFEGDALLHSSHYSNSDPIWDPSQGHVGHYSTPPDANMTDPSGNPVYVDPSGTIIWDPAHEGHSTSSSWDSSQGPNMTDGYGHAVHVDPSGAVNWDPASRGHSANSSYDQSPDAHSANASYDAGSGASNASPGG